MQAGSGQPESPDTQQDHRTSVISGTEIDVYGNCRVGVNFAVSLFFMQEISLAMFPAYRQKHLAKRLHACQAWVQRNHRFRTRLSQKRKLAEATHICRLFHMISCAYTGRVGKANIQWKEVGEIYGKQL